MADELAERVEELSVQDEQDEPDIQECLSYADELKAEGNEHFRAQRWNEALAAYRMGLGRLPKLIPPVKTLPKKEEFDSEDLEDQSKDSADTLDNAVTPQPEDKPKSEMEERCSKARSVLSANIGACFVQLEEHKEAVDACSQALLDDPNYIKALQRRAASNEKIASWSALTSAQDDYNKLLTLLPSSTPQHRATERTLYLLKPRVEAAQKKETAEMLDKLKSLGNSFLGNFGLSTDNFKFDPNGQGGYSMNFTR